MRRRRAPATERVSTGPAIADGHHPHYATVEDDGYAVVTTDWGRNPRIVERGLRSPKDAARKAAELNRR